MTKPLLSLRVYRSLPIDETRRELNARAQHLYEEWLLLSAAPRVLDRRVSDWTHNLKRRWRRLHGHTEALGMRVRITVRPNDPKPAILAREQRERLDQLLSLCATWRRENPQLK